MGGRAARRSGDGWFRASDGRVHWGRFGAAGLLLRHAPGGAPPRFLLAQRAAWVHRGGGEWAIPGGARDEGEDPLDTALREFDEELGALPAGFHPVGRHVADVAPGEWSYVTLCADVAEAPEYHRTLSLEHDAARWASEDQMRRMRLFGPFAAALPDLLALFPATSPPPGT